MRTRLLPVLALALASTVGCSSTPPSVVSTQPQADAQRQIAQADDEVQAEDGQETQALADAESKMPAPMSVQALPQRLDPSQVVDLPADKMKEFPTQALDSEDRSIQQRRGGIRSFGGYRGFSGWRGRGLRYYSYGGYYYPYFLSGSYYYPYAYYPYTYAYYPYSYYNYNYYPYYSPFYTYGSFYYPYSYGFFGRYGRYSRYGRYGYARGFRGRGR